MYLVSRDHIKAMLMLTSELNIQQFCNLRLKNADVKKTHGNSSDKIFFTNVTHYAQILIKDNMTLQRNGLRHSAY